MLAHALATALVAWLIARFVLDANPLAWPLTAFLMTLLQAAATMFGNHRPDLLANGIALAILTALALLWTARSATARTMSPSGP